MTTATRIPIWLEGASEWDYLEAGKRFSAAVLAGVILSVDANNRTVTVLARHVDADGDFGFVRKQHWTLDAFTSLDELVLGPDVDPLEVGRWWDMERISAFAMDACRKYNRSYREARIRAAEIGPIFREHIALTMDKEVRHA